MTVANDNAVLSLPDDIAACHELIRSLTADLLQSNSRLAKLQADIEAFIRDQDKSRERYIDPDQGELFPNDGDEAVDGQVDEDSTEDDDPPKPKKRPGGTGRRTLDPNRRREELLHKLRDDQKQCSKCGCQLTIVLVNGALQWAYQPSEIYGIQHVHEKGFCNGCHEHAVRADKPPQIIEKGAADASLLAHLTTSKQGDHLPLYRYEEISLRSGWWMPRSTLAGWLSQTSLTAVILYCWMASRLLNGKLLGTDSTGAPVLEPGSGKVQKGNVWVYCGQQEVCPYLIYEYTRNGDASVPRQFLDGYQGYLQADAATVFDELYTKGTIFEVACGAHMRRYFYKSRDTAPLEAHRALVYFRQLYMLERKLAGESNEVRLARRREEARPLLTEFKRWLDELAPSVIPKTNIAKAVGYALNQWDAFIRYCEEGWLLIDNTRSERALRPIAIGRKNWLFFGNDSGGRTGAILYSLVASAKANRVHPYMYLESVYRQLPMVRETASLLPILRAACESVVLDDGTRPAMNTMTTALDYLRVLKDHPRPLIELMRDDSQLDDLIIEPLNAMLPDNWLAENSAARLEINRATRIVGEPDLASATEPTPSNA